MHVWICPQQPVHCSTDLLLFPSAGSKWTRPEQVQERRPVFIVNATRPGSDLLGSASAALSATAMAFRASDVRYSLKAANHAVQLYK